MEIIHGSPALPFFLLGVGLVLGIVDRLMTGRAPRGTTSRYTGTSAA